MSLRFEELDWQPTPWGDISLRRRRDPLTGTDVHEVKLGDEFLMSSLFTEGEIALSRLGLAAASGPALDVAVGGLGLGYTAAAALDEPRVASLVVVEALPQVISWHQRHLVPLGERLTADPRCRFVEADFFARAAEPAEGLDPAAPGRRFDAILLDIDHSPRHVLNPRHAALYTEPGLTALARLLNPDGIFALWSNDPPDEEFTHLLGRVFTDPEAHVVPFANPLQGGTSTNSVYLGRKPPEA